MFHQRVENGLAIPLFSQIVNLCYIEITDVG